MKELILRDEKKYEKRILKKIIFNENFIKSILLIAAECVLYHHNVPGALFNKIVGVDYLNLDVFQFWKIINPCINLVAIMDNNIIRHLSEIEIVLLTFLTWSMSENFNEKFRKYLKSSNFVGK